MRGAEKGTKGQGGGGEEGYGRGTRMGNGREGGAGRHCSMSRRRKGDLAGEASTRRAPDLRAACPISTG